MNIRKLNIFVVLSALSALAGCSTNDIADYSHGQPILSAADARAMIHVEIKTIEPAPTEQELVAAAD